MKRLIILVILILIGCRKMDIQPTPSPTPVDIFSITESNLTGDSYIYFQLKFDGIYTMKLIDKSTNQVISKEKINGKIGANTLKIYTKTLFSKYLYLTLEDSSRNQVGKTLLNIQ